VSNFFRTEGGGCHECYARQHLSVPFCELFSLLDFIASEFCIIWLCNEVFVKWSFYGAEFSCSFIWVIWDSYKTCLFCTVGIETVLYDCYESPCMMSLLWWVKNICWCVFYDPADMHTACSDSMIEAVAWNEASCVVLAEPLFRIWTFQASACWNVAVGTHHN